jgi:hypothetical protein
MLAILSSIAVLAVSLTGYSVGATIRNEVSVQRKISILDIFVVATFWLIAIYSGSKLFSSVWASILFWFTVGIGTGLLNSLIIERVRNKARVHELSTGHNQISKKNRFSYWQSVLHKSADFQARILLGFMSLIILLPVSLIVKIFSDYLSIKGQERGSHWLPKINTPLDIGSHRKQS